jgi:FkbM family methyltransferase
MMKVPSASWPIRDRYTYDFALHGCRDWRFLAVARCVVRPGDTVLEVGANIGTETVILADLVGDDGRVVAFEPVAENAAALRAALDPRVAGRVDVIQEAVADDIGTVGFHLPCSPEEHDAGHLAPAPPAPAATDRPAPTKHAPSPPVVRPSLIVVNAKGAEVAVVRGASRTLTRWRPILIVNADAVDAHRIGTSLYTLLCGLRFHGYAVRAIRRYGLRRVDTSLDAEPCKWVAVPCERKELLSRMSRSILVSGALPAWPPPWSGHVR